MVARARSIRKQFVSFNIVLKKLVTPWKSNPGFDLDTIITYVGLGVWAICVLGSAFIGATIPPEVSDVAQFIFGIGLGRTTKPD